MSDTTSATAAKLIEYASNPATLTRQLTLQIIGSQEPIDPSEQIEAEKRRRRAKRRFKKAGTTVLGAIRFGDGAMRAEEERIQAELDGDEIDDDDDDEDRPELMERLRMALYLLGNSVLQSINTTVYNYPKEFLTAALLLNYLNIDNGAPGNWDYPGVTAIVCTVRIRDLYTGFAYRAATNLMFDLVDKIPQFYQALCWKTSVDPRVLYARTFLRSIVTFPALALEQTRAQVVANSFLPGLTTTTHEPTCEGARSVLNDTTYLGLPTWFLARGIGGMIAGRSFWGHEHWSSQIAYFLPRSHPLAETRPIEELVELTPSFVPRYFLAPMTLLPLPNFEWFKGSGQAVKITMWSVPLGWVFGIPMTVARTLASIAYRRQFVKEESVEDHLTKRLEHAATNASQIRGKIDVPSLTRIKSPEAPGNNHPLLKRQTTMEVMTKAAIGLAAKQQALLKRCQERSAKLALKTYKKTGHCRVSVKRENIRESLTKIARLPVSALLRGSISIGFEGESGVDAGGLFRDYMQQVAEMIKGEESLFVKGPDGGLVPLQQETGGLWREELFAIGRLMALAITNRTPLDVSFGRAIYKVLLGEQITHVDAARADPDFIKHRVGEILKEGGVEEMEMILCDNLYFVGIDGGVDSEPKELVEGGTELRVNEQNKRRYVALLVENHLVGHIRGELAVLIEGFRDIIPRKLLHGDGPADNSQTGEWLTSVDLDLIVAGLPHIDVDDWKESCGGAFAQTSTKHSELRDWFWECVGEMSEEERAKLLSFSCGSSRVPAQGFKGLRPNFNVSVTGEPLSHLPSAHTCGNNLCIPAYTSREQLKERIGKALSLDAGFGFM